MSVLGLVATVVPLFLLSALSPVIFVNASSLQLQGSTPSVLRYVAGNVLVVAVIGVIGAGLLGATLTNLVEHAAVSAGVDLVLACVLLGYGIHLSAGLLHRRHNTASPDPSSGSPVARGVVSMGTNFTSIPLVLAASQHLGGAGLPVWAVVASLAIGVGITVAPAWLPLALTELAPRLLERLEARFRHPSRPDERSLGSTLSGLLPVLTCMAGAVFLTVHALAHL